MHLCNPGLVLLVAAALSPSSAAAADYALGTAPADTLPAGVAEPIAKLVDAKAGHAIKSGDKTLAHVWLVQGPPLSPTPNGQLGVNYQFTNGQLLGVLEVTGDGEFGDFRDQKVAKGVYTLRYGLQPMDGNHIGTSETSDFLLALPAAADKQTADLDFTALTTTSAKSVASAHPAIFSMLAPGKSPEKATLDAEGDFQVLTVPVMAKQAGKPAPVGVRVIVVGHGDE
jgi:hypothetical protein